MAENKKSFLLYADILAMVSKLPDETAGKLFKIILEYVNDKNPVVEDLLLSIAFEPIKLQLKRDLAKYESIKETSSENGIIGNLKRWHLDLYNDFISKKITLDKALSIAESRKSSPPDERQSPPIGFVAVNDTVSVNVIDIINSIMSFFDFNEITNPDKLRDCSTFINLISHQKILDDFILKFDSYKKLKEQSPKYKHSFKNFIGTSKELFLDGAWNAENWQSKLTDHIQTNKVFDVKGATDQSNNKDLFK